MKYTYIYYPLPIVINDLFCSADSDNRKDYQKDFLSVLCLADFPGYLS